jgi:hypothetical protein
MKDRCIKSSALVVFALLLFLLFPSSAIALSNPVINEFLPNPAVENKEWVELYNPDKIELASFFLDDDTSFTDDAGSSSKKSLTSLLASDSTYPYIELSSFLNNNSGDFVVLFDGTGNIVDEFEYTDDPGVDVAIGRWPDGNGELLALAQATKGSANSQPKPTPTEEPTNTPVPTNTPKPTKTPTPTRVPTPTKTPALNQKNTLVPTQKSLSKLPSISPLKSSIKKLSVSPTKISSRSATPNILGISTKSASLTPTQKKANKSVDSSLSPVIFISVAALIFIICAILVALKIKWKQRQ